MRGLPGRVGRVCEVFTKVPEVSLLIGWRNGTADVWQRENLNEHE